MAILSPWQQAAQDTINQVGFDPNKHPEVTQPASPAARTRYGALAEQQGALAIDGTTHASPPAGEPPKQQAEPVQTVPEGVAVPDPNVNPGGALSATAMNRAAGLGTGTGLTPPPQAPQMKEVNIQIQEQEGKQVMFDMNKIPKPMESQAFNMGLISMGLNLLAGNDIATSFAQGAAAFDQSYGREKREIWAQDLAAQGYDAHEIQAWVASGDPKALSDPMEKKMRQQQYTMGQHQLAKAAYENSPEYMAYQQERQAWNDNMEIARFQSQQNFQNENLRISQANLALSQQKLDMEIQKNLAAAQGGKPNEKMFMSGLLNTGLNYKDVLSASSYVPSADDYAKAMAVEAMPKYMQEYAKQSWTPEMHKAIQMRNQVSELLGRGLSGAALSEITERPTWANALLPTQEEIKNNDIVALKRKENAFNALKIYANSFSEKGKGALNLNDVDSIANGNATILVDDQTGLPAVLLYKNGQHKPLY